MSGLTATQTFNGLFAFVDRIDAVIVIARLPNNGNCGFRACLEHESGKRISLLGAAS